MSEQYIYAVARIRSKEMRLLDGPFMEQLLAEKDEAGILRLLNEKGWGESGMPADEMLAAEEKKTWDTMRELVKDIHVFDVFLYENDYHNLKAAVKDACRDDEQPGIYIEHGTVDPALLKEAVAAREFRRLPEEMQTVAQQAMDELLRTRDGQLCDIMIDKAAMEAISKAGKRSGSELMALYGEMMAVTGDIRIAVRASAGGKSADFIRSALADCETLNEDRLAQAAVEGKEALIAYLGRTPYADAAPYLAKSQAAFEKWCDNLIMHRIRPQLSNPFGLDPLAAYILARKNEIRTVRIILTGKRNELPDEEIRERVRDTYV